MTRDCLYWSAIDWEACHASHRLADPIDPIFDLWTVHSNYRTSTSTVHTLLISIIFSQFLLTTFQKLRQRTEAEKLKLKSKPEPTHQRSTLNPLSNLHPNLNAQLFNYLGISFFLMAMRVGLEVGDVIASPVLWSAAGRLCTDQTICTLVLQLRPKTGVTFETLPTSMKENME